MFLLNSLFFSIPLWEFWFSEGSHSLIVKWLLLEKILTLISSRECGGPRMPDEFWPPVVRSHLLGSRVYQLHPQYKDCFMRIRRLGSLDRSTSSSRREFTFAHTLPQGWPCLQNPNHFISYQHLQSRESWEA